MTSKPDSGVQARLNSVVEAVDETTRHDGLLENVLPGLNDVLRDLAAKGNSVRTVMLGEAAEDSELGAKHVALGDRCDDLSSGELDLIEG